MNYYGGAIGGGMYGMNFNENPFGDYGGYGINQTVDGTYNLRTTKWWW